MITKILYWVLSLKSMIEWLNKDKQTMSYEWLTNKEIHNDH